MSCSQTQSEMVNDTACRIANHTWQFPPFEVARMLSPKGPKHWLEPAGELLPLDHYDCMVDELAVQNALHDVVLRLETDEILTLQSFIEPHDLAGFLTRCIGACHDALDKQPNAPLRQDRWFNDLQFTVTSTIDDGSGSLQPHITGGHRFSVRGDELLYWDPLEGKSTDRSALPVEVGVSWKQIVSRASEDACRLFDANRTRLFAIVLGFNQDENALQFLIFHPGGLTASWPCSVAQPGGLKGVGRLFLALASWRTPGDAGFIPSYTNTAYMLPSDQSGESYTLAAVDDILSRPPRIRGRMTAVSRLRLLPMEGGSSRDLCSNSIPTLPQTGRSLPFPMHDTTKSTTLSPWKSFVREPIQSCQGWTVRSL